MIKMRINDNGCLGSAKDGKITLLEWLPNVSSMPHLSSSWCFPSTCDLFLDLCVQHSSSAVFEVWDVFFSSSYHFLLYLTIYKYHATCKKNIDFVADMPKK